MRPITVISANIAISYIVLKTTFFRQYFCRRKYRNIFNHFYVMRLKLPNSVK